MSQVTSTDDEIPEEENPVEDDPDFEGDDEELEDGEDDPFLHVDDDSIDESKGTPPPAELIDEDMKPFDDYLEEYVVATIEHVKEYDENSESSDKEEAN